METQLHTDPVAIRDLIRSLQNLIGDSPAPKDPNYRSPQFRGWLAALEAYMTRPRSGAQIAAHLRVSRPTAYALLHDLEKRGRATASGARRAGARGPLAKVYTLKGAA